MSLIQAIPRVRRRRGRPHRRPDRVYADRGYDHDKYRKQVRTAGITPVIARRGTARSTAHGSGLGTCRWVAGQSIALLHWFRRLRIRWEIRGDIPAVFPGLACAITWRRLRSLLLCPGLLVAFPVSPGAVQAWRGVLLAGSFCPAGTHGGGCAMHGYSILCSSRSNLGTIYPNGDVARVSLSVWVCGGPRHAA